MNRELQIEIVNSELEIEMITLRCELEFQPGASPKFRNDKLELRNCIKMSEVAYKCPKPEPLNCI